MIPPGRKDVEPVTRYDEERFGGWLLAGFNAYYLNDKGRHAFVPMQSFVGLDADLVEDLANIYGLLEVLEQRAFRAGLAIALARTDMTAETIPVLESMLGLAASVGAWEILPAIIDKHRFNWLLEEADDTELFDATVRTIVALSANAGTTNQTRRSAQALIDIGGSAKFPASYAEPVMVALCRLQPDRAWPNLLALRWRLDPRLERVEGDDVEEARRADIRMRFVNRMYEALGELNFVKALKMALAYEPYWERDWWVSTVVARRRAEDVPQAAWWRGEAHPSAAFPFHLSARDDRIRPRPKQPEPPTEGVAALYAAVFPSGRLRVQSVDGARAR